MMSCSFMRQKVLFCLVIMPRLNAVKCIGYGDDSSHFKGRTAPEQSVHPIFPLRHPEKIEEVIFPYDPKRYVVAVRFPGMRRCVMLKMNFIWWTWRWFRRNFVARTLYPIPDQS